LQSEAACAGLVGAAGQRNIVLHIEIARRQMLRLQADLAEHGAQLVVELAHRNLVVRLVRQDNPPFLVDGHPIVGIGQVLRGQPEIDGVAGDIVQHALRHQGGQERLLGAVHAAERLADHLDIAHRIGEALHPEIEIVKSQRLLKHRVVRRQGQREHRLAVVKHIVSSDLPGAVRKAGRMLVIG
jgi:hypothetical protein